MRALFTLLLITSSLPAQVTFTKDIAPILYAKCTVCHRPDEVGPFPLITYADAKKRANQLARITEKRIMPPWKPIAAHGEFRDARVLNAAQIAVFKRWADAGAPEGKASDLPKLPQYPEGWALGEPDLILKVSKPYEIPAEGPDVYVHFVLPLNFEKDKYIRAIQVRPSNRRVAHHGQPILDGSGTARRLAQKHGGESYPNFGGPGFIPRGFLPGYAPGLAPREVDKDTSFVVGKGMDLVLQMHYHPTGKREVDQPVIGLYFTDKPPKRGIAGILMGTEDVDIPAGEKAYTRTDTYKIPVDFEVRGIWGHMHMIGKKIDVWAELPSGKKRTLLKIDDWDFNWQDTYAYAKPFILPKGTVVKAQFVWDNSTDHPRNPHNPPKRITLGEQSTDEMAGLWIGGVTKNGGLDDAIIWAATIGHYFEIAGKKSKKP